MPDDIDLERVVEDHLEKKVKEYGGQTRKVQWIERRGAPDRLVMFPEGWLYWVELKCLNGIIAPHQAREHKRLINLGQVVFVPFTKEDIDVFLDKHKPVGPFGTHYRSSIHNDE